MLLKTFRSSVPAVGVMLLAGCLSAAVPGAVEHQERERPFIELRVAHEGPGPGLVHMEPVLPTADIEHGVYVEQSVIVSDSHIESVHPSWQDDTLILSVQLTQEGVERMETATRENLGRRVALILDGELSSAPVVRAVIRGGRIQAAVRFPRVRSEEVAAEAQSRWPTVDGGAP